MTLDDLAAMISRMDERIEARFEKVDERFDRLEQRLGALETGTRKGFEAVSEEVKKLKDIHLEELNRRVNRLEEAVFHR